MRKVFLAYLFLVCATVFLSGCAGHHFKKAQETHTLQAYQDFIGKYPKKEEWVDRAEEVQLQILRVAWRQASSENSTHSYQIFLALPVPASFTARVDQEWKKYQTKARDGIMELEYQTCRESDNLSEYRAFREKYPTSPHLEEANQRIMELEYEECKVTDTIEEYERFTGKYPANPYQEEIQISIARLQFVPYQEKDTIESYGQFIVAYPDSPHLKDARQRITELEFKPYQEKDTVEGYQEFLVKYPTSPFQEEAVQAIDRVRWFDCKTKHEIPACRQFLKDYPESAYCGEAREFIDDLEYEPYAQDDSTSSYWNFSQKYPNNRHADEAKDKAYELVREYVTTGSVEVDQSSSLHNYTYYVPAEYKWENAAWFGEDWRLKQQYGTGETRTGGYHTYSPNIALGCVVENRSNVTIRAKVSFFPFLDYFGAKSGGGIFGVLLNFVGNEVIKSSRIRHPVYSEWIKLAPHTEKTVWVRGILKHEYAVTGADTKLDLEIVQ